MNGIMSNVERHMSNVECRARATCARPACLVLVLTAMTACPNLSAAGEPQPLAGDVLTAEGRRLAGEVRVADGKVRVGGETAALGAVVALRLTRQRPAPAAWEGVVLAGGDRLAGRAVTLKDGTLTFAGDTLGTVALEASKVEAVFLGGREPEGAARAGPAGLVLANGDQLPGTPTELSETHVAARVNERLLRVSRTRCWAVLLAPARQAGAADANAARPAPAETMQFVRFANGDILSGRLVRLDAGRLVLAGSAAGRVDLADPDVAEVWTEGPDMVPLSVLAPGEVKHVPQFDEQFGLGRDRTLRGGALSMGGWTFARGLACHSRCELTYALSAGSRRLVAEIGLDDVAAGRGEVSFRVEADGRSVYDSGPVCGGQAPRAVGLNISGAKALRLIVDFGPDGSSAGDHADWARAVIVR